MSSLSSTFACLMNNSGTYLSLCATTSVSLVSQGLKASCSFGLISLSVTVSMWCTVGMKLKILFNISDKTPSSLERNTRKNKLDSGIYSLTQETQKFLRYFSANTKKKRFFFQMKFHRNDFIKFHQFFFMEFHRFFFSWNFTEFFFHEISPKFTFFMKFHRN